MDYGFVCEGDNSETCMTKCIDNNNGAGTPFVPNCKSYTKIDGIKSFSGPISAIPPGTPCCVCKDGYDGTDAGGAAIIPDLTDENVCKITKCTKKVAENCVEKDANDKCILCIVGYKLDIKTNTCLESCTDLTDRY